MHKKKKKKKKKGDVRPENDPEVLGCHGDAKDFRVTRRWGRFRSILDLMGLNASIFELFFFNWPKISHRFHFFSLVRT